MEKHQVTVDIAAYGWESESWQGFYPADLPEDWRLDFYCNEFRAVVVPTGAWQKIGDVDLEEWRENAHEQFRFYFEKSSKQVSDSVDEMIESLGAQWGGWICHEDDQDDDCAPSVWYEGETEPRKMRELVEGLDEKIGTAERGVVVVNSPDEPWEVASNMRQLVELMGYG